MIRIQGIHLKPQENTKNDRPRREAIIEAMTHFESLFPKTTKMGIIVVEKYVSLALLNRSHYDDISANFQECIVQLGECVAGDEKLFRYTGHSRDVRCVPNKPSKVG